MTIKRHTQRGMLLVRLVILTMNYAPFPTCGYSMPNEQLCNKYRCEACNMASLLQKIDYIEKRITAVNPVSLIMPL